MKKGQNSPVADNPESTAKPVEILEIDREDTWKEKQSDLVFEARYTIRQHLTDVVSKELEDVVDKASIDDLTMLWLAVREWKKEYGETLGEPGSLSGCILSAIGITEVHDGLYEIVERRNARAHQRANERVAREAMGS